MKTKQLPQGWKEVELGKLYNITSSKRVFQSEWKNKGIPFYRAREIVKLSKNGWVNNELFISKEMYNDYSKKYGIPKEGDIMVTGVGTLGVCYLVKKGDKFYFKDGNIIWLKKKEDIESNYVKYLFQSNIVKRQINSSLGTTVGTYTIVRAKKTKIPLPPIQTQKKIVQILEKAESLKKLRKQSDDLTKNYLKSVFNKMFLQKSFLEVELGDITKIVSGSTPSTLKKENWNGKINWVTPAELIDGENYYYNKTRRKISEIGLKSCSAELFPRGTIILTTRAPIGKVAIAGDEMCSNQGFKNFIPFENINSVYLYFWLLLKKDYLNSLGRGATFKEISKKIVSSIKIPLPPLPLQKRFASIVKQVEKLKEYQEQSNQEINNLFNALMQKAFKGEL